MRVPTDKKKGGEKTKRGILAALLVALLVLSMSSFSVVSASPNERADESTDKSQEALEGTPANDIEAVTLVFYGKPEWAGKPGGPSGPKEDKGGYKLLRGGVKLGETASYSINPAGSGVGEDATISAIVAAFETWDAEVNTELFDNVPMSTDNKGTLRNSENVISWDNLKDTNVVAQCTIWFYVNTKEIIEFDIVFNTQQPWGIDDNIEDDVLIDAYDIQNIATHESGHTLHLGDLYEGKYSEMTMYGYANMGETKKRSLEWGDQNGVHKLYGA